MEAKEKKTTILKQQTLNVMILLMQLKHCFQWLLNSTLLLILLFSSWNSNSPPPAVISSGQRLLFLCSGTLVVLTLKAKCFMIWFHLNFLYFCMDHIHAGMPSDHYQRHLWLGIFITLKIKKKNKKQCARKQGQQEVCSVSSASFYQNIMWVLDVSQCCHHTVLTVGQ